MTCWKWFDGMLKEAGIKVTDKNKDKIDKVIHRYVASNRAMDAAQQTGAKLEKRFKTMKR